MDVGLDQRVSLRQQLIFLYGTGTAVGLYLALIHLYIWRSWRPFFVFLIGALLFSTAALGLWRWVFPRIGPKANGAIRVAGHVIACLLTFGLLSLLVTEVDAWFRDGGSVLKPYRGGDRTITIPADAIRWAPVAYSLIPIAPTVLLVVVGYHLYWLRFQMMQARQRELRELAVSAQLAALRAQVNPHFFFNSLNSIAQLIATDPEKAEACVERLAEIFRYMLKRSDNELVSLADELEIAEAYLHIEKARFGANLRVEEKVDDQARGVVLPGLILQPLVENAVKHGISQKIGGGSVIIEAALDHGDLRLSVADTGVGMRARDTVFERGVGLRSVRDRLVRLYGPRYAPTISSSDGEGTRVTVRVPLSQPTRHAA
ncbi:MAG TPA: histidine kinase [Terriglobales bacterium]|nr:histidine kinase [Terriglobales bacterium]